MKLVASAALLLAVASSAPEAMAKKIDTSASVKLNAKVAQKLVKQSRHLDEENNNNNNNNQNQDEWSFLMSYKMKFVMCAAGERFMVDNEYESSSIIFRLCPDYVENEKESQFGCTDEEKYGDYITGINTYVGAYAEALEEQQNGNGRRLDQEFNLREYAECAEADFDMDNDGRKKRKLENQQQIFIGPECSECSEEGKTGKKYCKDIKLSLFTNEGCSYKYDKTYSELTNGYRSLPYEDGGLAREGFTSCQQYDNGNYEASEYCQRLYEDAGKCEQYNQYYCETIETLEADLKAAEAPSKAGKVILILILILLFFGLGWYAFKLYQKKKAAEASGEGGEGSGPFNQLA